ncbi:hypothetical protein Zmor_007398 [Zophobas morio]|uniref:Uncharacterized protein n=1 Tax=Zophobas morio TaxID=2755281 RepID=A0AA38J1X4_9CUCU|nr:hypothetical protein Zmor_007398 [Zophobas morio]
MDLTRPYFRCLNFTYCSRRWFPFKLPRYPSRRSPSPFLGLFWNTRRDIRLQAFLYRTPSGRVTHYESTIIAAHTRKPISVVPGRHMGLFRNNIFIEECVKHADKNI